MLNWFKKKYRERQERQRIAREIEPETFRTLARELRDLAVIAQRLWPRQHTFYAKIRRIQTEMEQLDKLASKPEFRRLSPEKRMQLRESLIQSRDQLIETVQTAPSPTSLLQ